MKKLKVIEVKDESLIEMGLQLRGYRTMLDDIALDKAILERAFWLRAKKVYPELEHGRWVYDFSSQELIQCAGDENAEDSKD